MQDASPVDDTARLVLVGLIGRNGQALGRAPGQLSAYLRNACGQYAHEIDLLVAAAEDHVPADIAAAGAAPIDRVVNHLGKRLALEQSLAEEDARWAVETWALALGRLSQDQLTVFLPPSGSDSTAPKQPTPVPEPTSTGWSTRPTPEPFFDPTDSAPLNATDQRPQAPPQAADTPNAAEPSPNGFTAKQPTAAVWPPPPTGQPIAGSFENTSGQHSTVPPEIASKKWNWGAFLLSWIWLLFHRQVIAGVLLLLAEIGVYYIRYLQMTITNSLLLDLVAIVVPIGSLSYRIYVGATGHKIAWRSRRYESIEQFFNVERKWAIGALILICLGIFLILPAIFLPVFLKAYHQGRGY